MRRTLRICWCTDPGFGPIFRTLGVALQRQLTTPCLLLFSFVRACASHTPHRQSNSRLAKPMQNRSHAVMAQRTEAKDSKDDFPTPPWATRALLEHVLPRFGDLRGLTCLEPACGAGHMDKVLREITRTRAAMPSSTAMGKSMTSLRHHTKSARLTGLSQIHPSGWLRSLWQRRGASPRWAWRSWRALFSSKVSADTSGCLGLIHRRSSLNLLNAFQWLREDWTRVHRQPRDTRGSFGRLIGADGTNSFGFRRAGKA